jgi:hypothetical protein
MDTVWVVYYQGTIIEICETASVARRFVLGVERNVHQRSEYTFEEWSLYKADETRVAYKVDLFYDGSICACYPIHEGPGDKELVWVELVAGHKPPVLRVRSWAKTDEEAIATAQSWRSRYLADGSWAESIRKQEARLQKKFR